MRARSAALTWVVAVTTSRAARSVMNPSASAAKVMGMSWTSTVAAATSAVPVEGDTCRARAISRVVALSPPARPVMSWA